MRKLSSRGWYVLLSANRCQALLWKVHIMSWNPPFHPMGGIWWWTEAQGGHVSGPSHTAAKWQGLWIQSLFYCDISMAVVQGNDKVVFHNSLLLVNVPRSGLECGAWGWMNLGSLMALGISVVTPTRGVPAPTPVVCGLGDQPCNWAHVFAEWLASCQEILWDCELRWS